MAEEAEDTGPAEGKVRLKYVGESHYREISKADFTSVGVEDQEKIRVAGESALVRNHDYTTPQVVEVSEDAAAFLLDEEADDWEETEEPPIAPLKAKATARRLARAEARERRALKKSQSASDTGGTESGGADSGSAGDGGAAGASGSTGRGARGSSTRTR